MDDTVADAGGEKRYHTCKYCHKNLNELAPGEKPSPNRMCFQHIIDWFLYEDEEEEPTPKKKKAEKRKPKKTLSLNKK